MTNDVTDRAQLLSTRRAEGYTHVVRYCLKGESEWQDIFCKSLKDAKIHEREYQERGHRAMWAGLNPQFPHMGDK